MRESNDGIRESVAWQPIMDASHCASQRQPWTDHIHMQRRLQFVRIHDLRRQAASFGKRCDF